MSSAITIFILLGFLWILAGIALLLHHLHPRTGLTPLMMYLGAIAAAMQLQGLRAIDVSFQDSSITLDAAILLPVLLFGILIVYITNGSVRGRSAAWGVLLISILVISFQGLLFKLPKIINIEYVFLQTYSLRVIAASIFTLPVDIIVLILGYQIISNLRHRYPSRFASGLALILALFVDAVIFSSLAFGDSSDLSLIFKSQISEKVMAGLALWPFLAIYVYRVVPRLPDSAATTSRPVMDIFTTNLQLETRARYHYSLLRTLSQINQLIVRATDPNILLDQTCEALVELRNYHLVWIGTLDAQTGRILRVAHAGFSADQIKEYIHTDRILLHHSSGIDGEQQVIEDIHKSQNISATQKQMMLSTGCKAAATFPMRNSNQVLGILSVYLERPNSFGENEIDLLQELADDLAYAIVSMKARNQQTLLQTSAETMQDGLLILNIDGEIIYANEIIAQFVGIPQSALTGRHVSSILSPQQANTIPDAFEALLQNDILAFDIEYQTGGGNILILAINTSLGRKENGEPDHIVVNIRNVTSERKYQHQLLTLHRLTTDLVQIHDPQILTNMILKVSEDVLGADASGIYLVDPENQIITETLTRNLPSEYSQRVAKNYSGLPGETSRKTLQPVYVSDTLNDSTYGDRIHFMAEHGIRALLILPVIMQENLIGALTIYYHKPHTFTTNDVQIGLTLAQTLAIVYQNAKLYQAEHSQRKLAEALVQAASSINSSLDLEQVLNQLLEQVMRVISCRAANIIMIEGEFGYFHSHRGYEDFPQYIDFIQSEQIPLSTLNLAQMISTGEPCLIPDTSQDQNWETFDGAEWIKGFAGIPLKVEQKVVGFLNVDSDQARFFTNDTVNRLSIFADYAATAIKNARLYQAELNQREFAEALAQAAASVSSSLELDDVLDHILEQAMRVVPCQAANIMLIEKEKVFLARQRGYENYMAEPSTLEGMEFPISWPGLKEMYSQGKPIAITDTHKNKKWQTASHSEWIRSFIGIPLKIDQQVVGFLNIDSDKPNHLTTKFAPRLQIFADHASTAIKNARAYENSRLHAEEMSALVTGATAVSKSLDVMQVLQIIAEQMTKVLQVKACAISNYDPDLNQVTLLTEHGPDDWEVTQEWYQPYDLNGFPLTRQVLEKNEPLHLRLDDPNMDDEERKFMKNAGIASLLMLPLVTQDRTIGLVELMDTQENRDFSTREIALGLSLASHAASALENANLYRRLQEYATELEKRVNRRTQQLQAATEYIEGILASVPDAIFVLNEKQEVIRANHAGEKLLAQAKATGLDLFKPQLLESLETGGGPNIQAILEVQDKAYQALSSQLSSDDGQTTGQVIVFRDVTRFRELDQMKTQFVSDVSHELRTPLTNLTLYLGLLTTVRDSQKQNDYILTMQRETERLTHLIEDLLTISRLEASRIHFQIRATDVNQLLDNLVCDRAFLAAQKNIVLDFIPAEQLPLVTADENMLTQALSNLLTNAINYTLPQGRIHVSTAHPELDWVTVQIADTGVGIPPDEMDRIFDRFYRGGASQKTGAEGTGLGLAISEEIIHRLNGKITLDSTPGEGSTFSIWLRTATDDML